MTHLMDASSSIARRLEKAKVVLESGTIHQRALEGTIDVTFETVSRAAERAELSERLTAMERQLGILKHHAEGGGLRLVSAKKAESKRRSVRKPTQRKGRAKRTC